MCYNIEGSDVDVEAKEIPSPEEISMDREGEMLDRVLDLYPMQDQDQDPILGSTPNPILGSTLDPILSSTLDPILKTMRDLAVGPIPDSLLGAIMDSVPETPDLAAWAMT